MAEALKGKKTGNVGVYMVSGLLFICILAGGALLGMYINLPETRSAAWYPAVGLVLVGAPWLFWFFIFMYTFLSTRARGPTNHHLPQAATTHVPATNGATTTTITTAATTTPSTESSGRGTHVRFGSTTVMGEEATHIDDVGGAMETHPAQDQQAGERLSHVGSMDTSTASNNGEGSPLGSHESELPLAFSMS